MYCVPAQQRHLCQIGNEMGLGFILGVLAGVIAVKIYEIAYEYYTWHTYKNNIDWDTDGE